MKIVEECPNYAVTKNGDVYRLDTMRKLKPVFRHGYAEVHLYSAGKGIHKKVHRLVAKAFIPNPNNLPCVNHKDENRSNNALENLEWCSYQYNNHYGKSKPVNNLRNGSIKNSRKVLQFTLNGDFVAEYVSGREAGRKTGLNSANINKCCQKKVNHAGGFVWVYAVEGVSRRRQALKRTFNETKEMLGL